VDRRAATLRFALALALLAPGAAARASEAEAVCANDLERRVLALVNAERAALGRPRLALDVRLNAAARRHAEDLHDTFIAGLGDHIEIRTGISGGGSNQNTFVSERLISLFFKT